MLDSDTRTSRKVPLCRASISDAEKAAVLEVLESGWLTHGDKTAELEQRFCALTGTEHAVAMNSCASTLFVTLKALNIRGEVIIPSFTFAATANAVVAAGATPVFCDIDPRTFNMDPDHVRSLVTARTEAIMPVHFGGQMCDMTTISKIATRHDLAVIEDSAETIGGTFDGKSAGSYGIGCFSFFPTKNITTGEGGMLCTNDPTLANKARVLISHGILKANDGARPWRREAVTAGFNFRLSNILAAIGCVQMDRLKDFNAKRQALATQLDHALATVPQLETPYTDPRSNHVFQMYVVKINAFEHRDRLVQTLRSKGIEASVHFDPPVHHQASYRHFCRDPLPHTETVTRQVVTLPMFPDLTAADMTWVAENLRTAMNEGVER